MFKVNDYVVYGSTGICRITDIVKDKLINGAETEYFILQSVCENNLTIKAPVINSNAMMREPISKDGISSLIATMPDQGTIWIKKFTERNIYFKAALKSGKCEEWAKLIKTIYMAKQGDPGERKKLSKSDDDIMQAAEKKLYGEFAITLSISPDEVVPYIREHIKSE